MFDVSRNAKIYTSFLLLVVLLFSACSGLENRSQQITDVYFVLQPSGTLVFVGVSPRLSNHEDSINLALRDAARRYSFFHQVSGQYAGIEHIGARLLDVYFSSEYQLQYNNELEKFLNVLEYDLTTDVFENNNAVFITTRVSSDVSMPMFRGHSFGQRPRWIDSPPSEIEGFAVGIGFSGRLSSHRDTVVRSYERAVISIIKSMESSIHGEQSVYQDTSHALGFAAQASGMTIAYGELENFYIIESWTDPANLSVWTLAVARKR